MYYLVSMGQDFRSHSSGWHWLRDSNEVVVRILADAAVSSDGPTRAESAISRLLTHMAVCGRP